MLAGLIAVRFVLVIPVQVEYHQLTIGAVWLVAAYAMGRSGHPLAAVFLALSGATYAVFLTIGQQIKFMGLAPVAADALWLAALASLVIGGGGKHVDNREPDRLGNGSNGVANTPIVARRES